MVLPPNYITRPSVRFSAQPPTVYPGIPQQALNMSGGGASMSSRSMFSMPQINLSNWFSTGDGKFVGRILLSFVILGILGWVLHRWFRSRLLEDAGYNPNCPTWLMGSPIAGKCSFSKENYKNSEESEEESDEESDEEEEKPKKKVTKKDNKKKTNEKKPALKKKKENFVVLGKPRADEQGQRDRQSYTQFRSSYGPKEIPHEYATCLTSNPDNRSTCDFWKNLDADPKPVRKLMRANDAAMNNLPPSSTYPMYDSSIPQPLASLGGGSFGNFAAVNFSN